jgi:hypothetical protein
MRRICGNCKKELGEKCGRCGAAAMPLRQRTVNLMARSALFANLFRGRSRTRGQGNDGFYLCFICWRVWRAGEEPETTGLCEECFAASRGEVKLIQAAER